MSIDRFPPRDYRKWYDLIRAVVEHQVERYSEDVVSQWYWEFWNEPDLRFYWIGTTEEYLKTYDYAAAAVKDALPTAKVGGCGPSHPEKPIFRAFLEHCTLGSNYYTGEIGSPAVSLRATLLFTSLKGRMVEFGNHSNISLFGHFVNRKSAVY